MCNIRLLNHFKTGCDLLKLTLTYCSSCPYTSKRPTSSSPSQTSNQYQIYRFDSYTDVCFSKKNKRWQKRLSTCPNWGGAYWMESEECPGGKFCQEDKKNRVDLGIRVGAKAKANRKSEEEDLMVELAGLEKRFDVEVEKGKMLELERVKGLERMSSDLKEVERVFESVVETLAGLEMVSRQRSVERKAWWSEDCRLIEI